MKATELQQTPPPTCSQPSSKKSAYLTYILCLLFGYIGLHRFYVRKVGTGLLMLITLGGLGLWVLIDLMFIVNNKFEDKQGQQLLIIEKTSIIKQAFLVIGTFIMWVVISIAIFITTIFILTSGMVRIALLQLQAINEENYAKAYSYTSRAFQKEISPEAFKQFVNNYPILKQATSASFNERGFYSSTGEIAGFLYTGDGQETPVSYSFIKENGTWKIIYIEIGKNK